MDGRSRVEIIAGSPKEKQLVFGVIIPYEIIYLRTVKPTHKEELSYVEYFHFIVFACAITLSQSKSRVLRFAGLYPKGGWQGFTPDSKDIELPPTSKTRNISTQVDFSSL